MELGVARAVRAALFGACALRARRLLIDLGEDLLALVG